MNAPSDKAKPARANLSTLHAICVAGLAMVSLACWSAATRRAR